MTDVEIRIAALEKALELTRGQNGVIAGQVAPEQRADDTLKVARKFEAYLQGSAPKAAK